jgi:hypothetical protein
MNARDAIKLNIESAQMVSSMYLEDMSDKELLHRPCNGANHINWQVGHLIAAEHGMMEKVAPGSMPPLPAGFEERYTKETSTSDKPESFCSKAELLKVAAEQRKGTLAALAKITDADLDKPTGVEYAPNVAAMFSLQGGHWMMHAGQWAVIRRQLGRPPLF